VAVGFALVGLLLSAVLAIAGSLAVTSYIDHQSERSAVALMIDNASFIRTKLITLDENPGTVMDELRLPSGAEAVLLFRGQLYPTPSLRVPLPAGVVTPLHPAAEPVANRIVLGGQERLLVGVPLADARGDALYGSFPLAGLRTTLRTLWLILLVGGVATSMLGMVIGLVASRRLLRPLRDVTAAAAAIAAGDLSARLAPTREPDLAGLAESFNRTAASLESRVLADARFAGDVSHELRTPLTAMLNSLALLQNRRGALPAELAEPLALLEADLMQFRKLVLDLLEMSRADAPHQDSPEPLQVGELVRRAADATAGRPVTTVDPDIAGVRLLGEKRRLERVVVNLVENAETHGGGCREVRVGGTPGGWRISVTDDGPGVPPEQRERVFDRFVRFDNRRPGSGLGLAIVARHVANLGGVVRVEDGPAGGARFVVDVPGKVAVHR
jgi:signal transduction histidine kinase